MPPVVVGAIGAAASAGLGALATGGAITFFGLSGFQALVAHAFAGAVISTLGGALQKKPKKPNFDFSANASNRTLQFRQPVTTRDILFGEVRVSGGIIYGANTENNKYLHLVIPLAGHKLKAINEIWLDDDVIPNDWLDENGMVTTGKYAGKVRIRKHLGEDGQTADPFLVAECPEWTENHRGRGVPYLYIRYEQNRDVFPNGLPNMSAVVQGLEIFDSRVGMTLWTPNPALHTYWYLTDTKYGFKASIADVAQDETEAAANACEEIVDTKAVDMEVTSVATSTDIITLKPAANSDVLRFQRGDRVEVLTTGTAPGGLATETDYYVIPYQFKGTPRIKLAATLDDAINDVAIDISSAGSGTHTIRKTGEPRYFGGGVISSANALGENLRDIMSAMGGKYSYTGGLWKIFAAVYRAPTETVDESDVRGKIPAIETRHGRDQSFNTVKGIYVSPENNWQPQDYPVVTNQAHIEADQGEQEATDLDLPMTQRASTAQRLATIHLNKHRQEIQLPYPMKLQGLKFQPCDTLMVNNSICGWSGKPFEIESWRFVVENSGDSPVFGTDTLLSETAAGVYSWDSEDELLVDPAPNTNFPDVSNVEPVIGLAVDSIRVETQVGDFTFRAVLSWQQHANAFVRQRGKIDIQYKKSADTQWLAIAPVEGDQVLADVFTGELGTNYDIRVRAINSRGVASAWNTLTGFTLGTAGGVTATEDWGDWTSSPGSSEDWGDWTSSPSSTDDYGGFSA